MAKGGRILVVEDEMLLAMALEDLLISEVRRCVENWSPTG